jgi:hypothetical protein
MRIWRTQVLSFFFLSLSLSEIRTFDDDSCTCWGDPNTSSKGCYWTVWYFDNNHQKYKFCSCERLRSVVQLHQEANWEVVAPTYELLLRLKDQKRDCELWNKLTNRNRKQNSHTKVVLEPVLEMSDTIPTKERGRGSIQKSNSFVLKNFLFCSCEWQKG